MRIVTWNINSLRARLERVEEWIAEVQPDVLCLQETKLADDAFPALTLRGARLRAAHYGQGQWNGVAILSKVGLDDVVTNFADGIDPDPDARIITATCGGVRISCCYVPNGRSLDDDHYSYKLSWLDRLRRAPARDTEPGADVIVTGDFNIAPEDRDVYDMREVPERDPRQPNPSATGSPRSGDWGLTDCSDDSTPTPTTCTRGGTTAPVTSIRVAGCASISCSARRSVAAELQWSAVDRNARKGKSPSDHAPVLVDLHD